MKKLFLLVLLLISVILFSTQTRIDSLETHLKSSIGPERAKILEDLADEYSSNRDYDKAIQLLEQVIEFHLKNDSQEDVAAVYRKMGHENLEISDYKKALSYYEKSLQVHNKLQQREGEFRNLSSIGYIYHMTGDYDKAIEYYRKAQTIGEQIGDEKETALVLHRIGSIYLTLEDYDNALEYYESALEIRNKINDKRGIAGSYNNIGNVYRYTNDFDKALEMYYKAMKLNDELGNLHWKSINLNNIGSIYTARKEFKKAIDYLLQSLEIKKSRNDKRGIAHTIGNIGAAYSNLGQIDEAIEYYLQSLDLSIEIGSKQHILQCYHDLVQVYAKKHDYDSAFEYLNLFLALNDSIFNEEKIKTITEIQTKYETDKKEHELELKRIEIRSQKQLRNLLIVILLLTIVLILLLIIKHRKEKKIIKVLHSQKKKLEKINAEIDDLNKNLEQRVETEVKIRREQEQKALEQSRLASLGELAAGIAHEINQPLHSVAFAIDNMKLALEENDADEEYLLRKAGKMFEDVERIKRIIDHIRTFSRKQAGEAGPFNINQSITNAVNMVREQYSNHRVRIETDLRDDLPDVMGNLYRFEQVVLILLSNGKDAVEDKAKTADDKYQRMLSIRTYNQESIVLMEFEDNGSGISRENQEKIFNPFYTTKISGKGTGLGLSIAFGIIGEMDGTIEVESELEKGTKMIIKLPEIKNR